MPLYNFSPIRGFKSTNHKTYSLISHRFREQLINDSNTFILRCNEGLNNEKAKLEAFKTQTKNFEVINQSDIPSDEARYY